MPMVGAGLAHSFEALIGRLPSWRDLPVLRRKPALFTDSPVVLAHLIEGEIIPRLLVAHRSPDAAFAAKPPVIGEVEADAFATSALALDAYALLQHVENFLDRGVAIDAVLIDLLAPAARRLGVYWEEDRCDFVDVTMGLWRLQELVHELAARMPSVVPYRDERRALFAVMPGDQHNFGMVMVDEFFRTAGWSTTRFSSGSRAELVTIANQHWFELIGLTITRADQLEQAPEVIDELRRSSRNPGIAIMVGGRMLSDRPELAMLVGADGTAPDARQAVARAEILLQSLTAVEANHC